MADAAERWRLLGDGNLRAAKLLYDADEYRASVGRSYYAAYQTATAACYEHGDQTAFAHGWNNPGHEQLPDLIRNNGNFPVAARRRVSTDLRVLREARESADYRPGYTISKATALDCIHLAGMIVRLLEG